MAARRLSPQPVNNVIEIGKSLLAREEHAGVNTRSSPLAEAEPERERAAEGL
ncbi:MAG: hypothetical protein ACK47B_22460 [Armatimonadota bacterium]